MTLAAALANRQPHIIVECEIRVTFDKVANTPSNQQKVKGTEEDILPMPVYKL